MSASTFPINGTGYVLQISTDSGVTFGTVAHLTGGSISATMETRDTTTKDSQGWRELREGLRSWNLSVDGFAQWNTESGKIKFNTLFGYISSRTRVLVRITNLNNGDFRWQGNAYCTSLESEQPMEDSVTFSASFEGTGVLTHTAIS